MRSKELVPAKSAGVVHKRDAVEIDDVCGKWLYKRSAHRENEILESLEYVTLLTVWETVTFISEAARKVNLNRLNMARIKVYCFRVLETGKSYQSSRSNNSIKFTNLSER